MHMNTNCDRTIRCRLTHGHMAIDLVLLLHFGKKTKKILIHVT